MEKNMRKECIIHITESLFYTAEIGTTWYFNYTSIKTH